MKPQLTHQKLFLSGERFNFYLFVFFFFLFLFSLNRIFNSIFHHFFQSTSDFGDLSILTIIPGQDNNLTQIQCSCSSLCSGSLPFPFSIPPLPSLWLTFFFFLEPIFFQIRAVLEGEEQIFYILYEPKGIITPYGENCRLIAENYGNFFIYISLILNLLVNFFDFYFLFAQITLIIMMNLFLG